MTPRSTILTSPDFTISTVKPALRSFLISLPR